MHHRAFIVLILSFLIFSATPSDACLKPVSAIEAEVISLGPNPGGLEQVEVHVRGFEMAQLSSPVGCTIGLGIESQILGPPAWAIQMRAIPTGLSVIDPTSGAVYSNFFQDLGVTVDFAGETLGLGYFSWPMPVWFQPLTTSYSSGLPQGEVDIVFNMLIKPQYTVDDFTDDLIAFGHVASDYSVVYAGITYLLWTSAPMVSNIDSVIIP